MGDGHRPQWPTADKCADRHPSAVCGWGGTGEIARHPLPWDQPEQGSEPEDYEDGTPAQRRQDGTAGQRSQRGTERDPHRDSGVRHATPVSRHLFGDDFRACRKGQAFANAQRKPQYDQLKESADKAAEQCRCSPQGGPPPQQAVDGESIAQPADDQLDGPVHPEEGRDGEAEFRRRQTEVILEEWRGDANCVAVDIIEEDGCAEQHD